MKKIFLLLSIVCCSWQYTIQAQNFDINVLKQTNLYRNKNLDPFFTTISNSVNYVSTLSPISVWAVGALHKNKKQQIAGMEMAAAQVVNLALTLTIKNIVNRPRPVVTYPYLTPLENYTTHSFPSGHTSSAFATATSISIALPKWYVIVPAYTWAGLCGFSRMHLGVHYPSDVAAGALLGAGSAYATHRLNKWFQKNKKWNNTVNYFLF